jgi:hypothetical protein
LRLLLVLCTSKFWYTQQLYFQHTLRLCISHGTDTIMTQHDTGRTEIPFGPFDVCIWVSFLVSFSRPGLPNRGYPSPVPILWHICRATKSSYYRADFVFETLHVASKRIFLSDICHESQMSTWHILLVVSTRIFYW